MKAKKFLSIILSILIMTSVISVSANPETLSDDIVILYTNDLHTYIDGPLSYDVLAAIKKDLQTKYKYVFLADAGDHIQGTAYGSMDKGESIIKLMNATGYDVATLGNHEFDYNMLGCMNVIELAKFPYVSANFHHEENDTCGAHVLDSYVMFDCGEEKLAFIGITTPETFTKSTPAYFQDEDGNFIYGISGGEDGTELKQDVQEAIDNAKEQGATKIIALGHLGIDPSSAPYTSKETIEGICGINVFIDGHSHNIIENEVVQDKHGHDVILTQTGEYFDRIGMMVIDSETDIITTDFIECEEILAADGETVEGYALVSELYDGKELIYDAETKKIKDEWMSEIDEKLGQKIGSATVVFDNYDQDGNRLVRENETNSGDFAADALYYLFDNMGMAVDVAIMNGGGIRNTAITGDLTYKTCKDMHTFGNVACLLAVTGQQILDALEWGSKDVGNGENGSFLHTSGLTYKIDTSIESSIPEKELEVWGGKPEAYRVYDVKIYSRGKECYEDIVPHNIYYLAGYNYTLRDLGGGFAMLDGSENILDYVMEDYMVLANYIGGFENGVVEASNSPLLCEYPNFLIDYSDVNGSGRIEITDGNIPTFDDRVWVGGVEVTNENKYDVFGDGGSVRYDDATNTLTLTDATITNEAGHGIYAYGQNLTINGVDTDASGNNAITGKCIVTEGVDEEGYEYTETESGCAIYVEGDGYPDNGNLVINGVFGDMYGDEGSAICAYRDIDISATIGDISCTGGLSSGIESIFGYVMINEDAVLGDITSEESNGISTETDLIISGKVGNITGNGYAGIYTMAGDVYIDGEVESIVGDASGIEAYRSVDWDENGNEFYVGGGVAISGAVGKIFGDVVGIRTDAALNISGNTTVEVSPEESEYAEIIKRAISAGGDIIMPEENIITEPTEYHIDKILVESYESDDGTVEAWHNSICTDGHQPALMVKFSGFVNPFEDVRKSDWYYNDVKYAVQNGLMNGTTETVFAPNDKLTRAMLVTILYRTEGEPAVNRSIPFADVEMGSWYANAVTWAQQNGIVNGATETTFEPNSNITREQIATIMFRYAQYKKVAPTGAWAIRLTYGDIAEISDYETEGVMYCTKDGLMKGKGNDMFCPKDNTTRAEIAAILHRFIEANK